jgi:hypothetical protein
MKTAREYTLSEIQCMIVGDSGTALEAIEAVRVLVRYVHERLTANVDYVKNRDAELVRTRRERPSPRQARVSDHDLLEACELVTTEICTADSTCPQLPDESTMLAVNH